MVDVTPGVTLREALKLPAFRRAAPEVLAGASYDPRKTDVWSVAVIFVR